MATGTLERQVHIVHEGKSFDTTYEKLGLETVPSDNGALIGAVESFLGLEPKTLSDHRVVSHTTADVVRPEAVYG